jgi:NAD(P)-dependent dehydrogenase (short-subunit alcohol dehydrogenase family)
MDLELQSFPSIFSLYTSQSIAKNRRYHACMDLKLTGKTALVTGGSRGIGRAVASRLASEGANVVIVARDEARVRATAEELNASPGGKVVGLVADMGSEVDVRRMVAEATAAIGPISILVNNAATAAGRAKPPVLAEITRDKLITEIDVKVLGYLFAAQAVAPTMAEAGWGRIINVAGLAARSSGSTIGSIRNVAVAALTKNLADELGPNGINVTCVHPGLTRTRSLEEAVDDNDRALLASIEERIVKGNAIRSMIDADDIAVIIAFLASPLSLAINGDAIVCGGGSPGAIYY